MSGFFSRLLLVAAFAVALAGHASAETMAETAKQWGLIGPWSVSYTHLTLPTILLV